MIKIKNTAHRQDKHPLLVLQDAKSRASVFQIMQLKDAGNQDDIRLILQMEDRQMFRPLIQGDQYQQANQSP